MVREEFSKVDLVARPEEQVDIDNPVVDGVEADNSVVEGVEVGLLNVVDFETPRAGVEDGEDF